MSGLSVHNLSVGFGGPPVLSGMSFQLDEGASLGLVGASGSGKSMTALASMGLLPAGAQVLGGSIQFQGKDISPEIRGRGIGLVFQEPFNALNPLMRVGDQIDEVSPGTAAQWLERVGLSPGDARARQYPHQYSGGMRQRALIALALAGKPRILIADEPTTALDATVQAQVLALIRQLQKELGFGLLIISHDLGVISTLAENCLVLEKGQVVEAGPVSQILSAPQSGAAKRLLAAHAALGSEVLA
jgi:ABC-type glutathione transport system ATPase component